MRRSTTVAPTDAIRSTPAAIGPRIVAQKWQDVFPTITTGYAYPWEDLKVKE